MDTLSSPPMFISTPLEDRAEQLATLLRAGLDDEFASQIKRLTKGMNVHQADALIALINARLAVGTRRRDLKLQVCRKTEDEATITVLDRSRLFGNGWSVCRQTFAV